MDMSSDLGVVIVVVGIVAVVIGLGGVVYRRQRRRQREFLEGIARALGGTVAGDSDNRPWLAAIQANTCSWDGGGA